MRARAVSPPKGECSSPAGPLPATCCPDAPQALPATALAKAAAADEYERKAEDSLAEAAKAQSASKAANARALAAERKAAVAEAADAELELTSNLRHPGKPRVPFVSANLNGPTQRVLTCYRHESAKDCCIN